MASEGASALAADEHDGEEEEGYFARRCARGASMELRLRDSVGDRVRFRV